MKSDKCVQYDEQLINGQTIHSHYFGVLPPKEKKTMFSSKRINIKLFEYLNRAFVDGNNLFGKDHSIINNNHFIFVSKLPSIDSFEAHSYLNEKKKMKRINLIEKKRNLLKQKSNSMFQLPPYIKDFNIQNKRTKTSFVKKINIINKENNFNDNNNNNINNNYHHLAIRKIRSYKNNNNIKEKDDTKNFVLIPLAAKNTFNMINRKIMVDNLNVNNNNIIGNSLNNENSRNSCKNKIKIKKENGKDGCRYFSANKIRNDMNARNRFHNFRREILDDQAKTSTMLWKFKDFIINA